MTDRQFILVLVIGWLAVALIALGLISTIGKVRAASPDEISVAEWFASLHNKSGGQCCGYGPGYDCLPAAKGELSVVGGVLMITMNGETFPVPDDRIVERADNPMAESYVCRSRPTDGRMSVLYCVLPFSGW